MTGESTSSDTQAISGSALLHEITSAFRSERAALVARWQETRRDDAQRDAQRDEGAEHAAARYAASPGFETLVDHYFDALDTGSTEVLQGFARGLAMQYPPCDDGSVGFLATLLSLRDLLARALTSRLQRSPGMLSAALDSFESAANRISEDVALGIVEEHARVIREQQRAIRQLSTPVLQVRAGLLLHPIMGTLDITRARHLTSDLLTSVRSRRGRVVVMDLTGVPTLDITVATQLVRAVEAVRLLGAMLIISGISPEAARALAATGLDLSALHAVGDLEDGMIEAEARLGLHIGTRSASSAVAAGD